MARIADRLDTWIERLKWPAAIGAILLLPAALYSFGKLAWAAMLEPVPLLPLVIGIGIYTALWRLLLRWPVWGSFISTFEHELTHALFATLTLHRVTGLKATWKKGGHMTFIGKGNWLITVAPYFFPTTCLVVLLASLFVPEGWQPLMDGLLGVSLAYHVLSTVRETHTGQSDLAKVGWPFALMFLPTANIFGLGAVVSFAYGGAADMVRFVCLIY